MWPNIWITCEGPSRVGPLDLTAWRVVEAQHVISTRKLVDTLDEQHLLEEILEGAKPPVPTGDRFAGLHFLLSTPFRYPPLENGSRFGRRHERSLWYGALSAETALAEKVYYQFVLLAGTTAALDGLSCDWTLFSVAVATPKGIDLTVPPFTHFADLIGSPTEYLATQELGTAMRQEGVEAIKYPSARCPQRGTNLALFEPAFADPSPLQQQTWRCLASWGACEVFALNSLTRRALLFPREAFEVNGRLPTPAV